ncbi:LLM class flavin-dependent oxidoreductase [Pedomonas mirosovicensis]|uniref:LLM class flavin-dependent oxidoreductase n=1 Tax=Pedomonas mirosovicensis TaxID=2908641 RepID=UPI002168537B|nr:LLM class flavin-dependent oxidoreductase [Pedomonas mirosovicensis]MCH8686322.1 LLM class flavin-dependent oxidoreductase [Pedomonas mirosovicensis]
MTVLSILDLVPIIEGGDASLAFRNSLDLAQHAERWGYRRYWLAEHHNMPGIGSSATAVAIGFIAGGTKTIRVGSGGIMLPNHAPLVVAEQFGTLEALYPGRIDLGLGRAPGTDQMTARALRRDFANSAERFPQDVAELQRYFEPAEPGQAVTAVPGAGLSVPIWLLGSSLFSAQLAASLGLPFAFASHFAPDHLMEALKLYRALFRPSAVLQKPYVMAGFNVFAADTEEEARRLFTSVQQQFVNLRRGRAGPLPPPRETMEGFWTPAEKFGVEHALSCSGVGTPEMVEEALQAFLQETGVDEVMATGQIYDHKARLRSFEILAEIGQRLRRDLEAD